MHFDLSPLRELLLRAEGVKVFGGQGGSYYHSFNVSLFADRPVRCEDSMGDSVGALLGFQRGKKDGVEEGDVMFCRSAAIPYSEGGGGGKEGNASQLLYVSSTVWVFLK